MYLNCVFNSSQSFTRTWKREGDKTKEKSMNFTTPLIIKVTHNEEESVKFRKEKKHV